MGGVRSGRILVVIVALVGGDGCARAGPGSVPIGGCRSDLRLVLGACVSPVIAEQACGTGSIATIDGCAARPPCEPGRARDLSTSECLARRDVRALASSLGILVSPDETLGCPDGGDLATGNVEQGAPRLGCLPPPGPQERACPLGSIADPTGCVELSFNLPKRKLVLVTIK